MKSTSKKSGKRAGFDIQHAERYLKRAGRVADKFCRSRSGFGAFRHFAGILEDTARLSANSALVDVEGCLAPGSDRRVRDNLSFIIGGAHQSSLLFKSTFGVPATYRPASLWALYWSLARAEHEFLTEWIPSWSHEERLTGELLAEMRAGFEKFSGEWKKLSKCYKAKSLGLSVSSFDVATKRQESLSGADFGLILHVKLPGLDEFFKSFLFQAKKVPRSGKARIDIPQANVLRKHGELGHYIFYHEAEDGGWNLVPTVLEVERVAKKLEGASIDDEVVAEVEKKVAKGAGSSRPRAVRKSAAKTVEKAPASKSVFVQDAGYELASFITFAGADPLSSFGAVAGSPKEAVSALTSWQLNKDGLAPSRIIPMTIAMGKKAKKVDWRGVIGREFDGFE